MLSSSSSSWGGTGGDMRTLRMGLTELVLWFVCTIWRRLCVQVTFVPGLSSIVKESTCCNRLYCRSNAFWKGGLQSRQYSTPCFFAASMLDQQIKISFAFYFCFVLFLQRAFCLDIFCFFNVALPQEVLAMANANSKIKTNMYCIVKEKKVG